MDVFFIFIWAGGIFAHPGVKIGLTDRVFWPVTLGEAIHAWALERAIDTDSDEASP